MTDLHKHQDGDTTFTTSVIDTTAGADLSTSITAAIPSHIQAQISLDNPTPAANTTTNIADIATEIANIDYKKLGQHVKDGISHTLTWLRESDKKKGVYFLVVASIGFQGSKRHYTQHDYDEVFSRDSTTDLAYSINAVDINLHDLNSLYTGVMYNAGVLSSYVRVGQKAWADKSTSASDVMFHLKNPIVSYSHSIAARLAGSLSNVSKVSLESIEQNTQALLMTSPHLQNYVSNKFFIGGQMQPSLSKFIDTVSMDLIPKDTTDVTVHAENLLIASNLVCASLLFYSQNSDQIGRFKQGRNNLQKKVHHAAVEIDGIQLQCKALMEEAHKINFQLDPAAATVLKTDLMLSAFLPPGVNATATPYSRGAGLHIYRDIDVSYTQKAAAASIKLADTAVQEQELITATCAAFFGNYAALVEPFVVKILPVVGNTGFTLTSLVALVVAFLVRYALISKKKKNMHPYLKFYYALTGVCLSGSLGVVLHMSHGTHVATVNNLIPLLPGMLGAVSAMAQYQVLRVLSMFILSLRSSPAIIQPDDNDKKPTMNTPMNSAVVEPPVLQIIDVPFWPLYGVSNAYYISFLFGLSMVQKTPGAKIHFPKSIQSILDTITDATDPIAIAKMPASKEISAILYDWFGPSSYVGRLMGYFGTKPIVNTLNQVFFGATSVEGRYSSVLLLPQNADSSLVKNPGVYVVVHFDRDYMVEFQCEALRTKTIGGYPYTLMALANSRDGTVYTNIDERWYKYIQSKKPDFIGTFKSLKQILDPRFMITHLLYVRSPTETELNPEKMFDLQLQNLRRAFEQYKTVPQKNYIKLVPQKNHNLTTPACEIRAAYLSAYPTMDNVIPDAVYDQLCFDVITAIPQKEKVKFANHPDREILFPLSFDQFTKHTMFKWHASEGRGALMYGLAVYFCQNNPATINTPTKAPFTLHIIDQHSKKFDIDVACDHVEVIMNPPTKRNIATAHKCNNCMYIGVIAPYMYSPYPHYIPIQAN